MMSRLFYFSEGYVSIRIVGKYPERFINLCLSNKIPIWGIMQNNNYFELTTSVLGYKKMRPLLKSSECYSKIVKKRGLPFVLGNMLLHKWLYGCLVMMIFLGLWSSSFIWFINLEAPPNIDIDGLQQVIREAGLFKGAIRSRIDTNMISYHIQTEYPKVRWVTIDINGVKANVKVLLRPQQSDASVMTGDIVARRDGYLEEIIVLDGTAKVKSGETLVKGQVLVEGRVYSEGKLLHNVVARALIKAYTWYYGNGLACSEYVELAETGERLVLYSLRINGVERHIYGKENFFDVYSFEESVYPLKWRNISTTVEVVKRVYIEQKEILHKLDETQVKRRADKMALASVLTKIGPVTNPVEISYKYTQINDMILSEIILKAEEDITLFKNHPR